MKHHLFLLSFLTIHCATYQAKKSIPAQKNNIPFKNKKETELKGENLPPGVFIIPNKPSISSAQTLAPFENKKREGDLSKAETQCGDSGITVFPEEKVFIGLKSRKLSKRVFKILEREEKRNLKHCRENCKQKNTYKAFIQIAPISSIPHSCPLLESKEVYAFQKTFTLLQENSKNLKTESKQSKQPILNNIKESDTNRTENRQSKQPILNKIKRNDTNRAENTQSEQSTLNNIKESDTNRTKNTQSEQSILNRKKSREKLERQMEEWILRTFVYPYIPGVRFTPTKELLSYKIDKACPKCSFYFDYNYFFKSGSRLNLDITVRCGDKKKGIGFTRMAKLQIKNQWQCSNVTEENQ